MTALKLPPRAFRDVNVNEIVLSEMDLRDSVNEDSLNELGDTMTELGVLQPILISHDKGKKDYRLIIGGRRLRSAKLQGFPTIPSFIVDDLQDSTALVMMLVENMQREALEPMEEARGLEVLRDRFKFNEIKTAKMIGRPLDFVEDRLALLRLPKEVQTKLEQGRIGVSQAICLTRIEGKVKTQIAIAHKIEEDELPVDIVERMVHESTHPGTTPRKKMARRYKVKRKGEPLSEAFTTKQLQRFVLHGEKFLGFLGGIALDRWSTEQAGKLCRAAEAFEQGFVRFKTRAAKRASQSQ